METLNNLNAVYEIKTKTHQGRKHIIVPVVMMVEGVHAGSRGALLHTSEALAKCPPSWNGIPVTIQHPQLDGINISANSPDVIDNQTVGRVYNTRYEDGKLKAEAWLDEEKLKNISPLALAHIKKNQSLEVSVGVFTEEEETPGEWHGETYTAIAKNHRPDHLALLPGGQGACSWSDGCGIRVNSNNNNNGGNEMIEKISPCCLAKVEQLISNKLTRFTDDDKAFLLAQEEAILDKLMPVEPEKVEPLQVNSDAVKEFLSKSAKNISDYVALMPQDMQLTVNAGLELSTKHRSDVIKNILDNTKDVWQEADLTTMSIDVLERISSSIKPSANYSVNGAVAPAPAAGEILMPLQ